MTTEAQCKVHEAVKGYLKEGEITVSWVLVAEIARPDGNHLIHRAGGGFDGTDSPMTWAAIGMLRSASAVAEAELVEDTEETDGE